MACSAPRSVTVKGYWRAKPRRKPKPQAAAYVVRDKATGKVRSRHRTHSAAVREETLANRALRRQGRKPHFEIARA